MDARRSHSHSDGRRRRRLATADADELLAEFDLLCTASGPPEPDGPACPAVEHRIVSRLISGRLWKHILFSAGIAAVAAAAIWLESGLTASEPQGRPHSSPHVTRSLAGLFFLLAGQLAFLIGWIRSESGLDFNGRYRWWKWLAAGLLGMGILWIADLTAALPELAGILARPIIGDVAAARRTLIVVPSAGLAMLVLSRIIPDMGRNRVSQILVATAVLGSVCRLLLVSSAAVGPLSGAVPDRILLMASGSLLCSLLLHARFVLYVCNDPPTARPRHRSPAPLDVSSDGVAEPLPPESAAQPPNAADREPLGSEVPSPTPERRGSRKGNSRRRSRRAA